MQIVAADIGNSSIKYAVIDFDDSNYRVPANRLFHIIDPREFPEVLDVDGPAHWLTSSVNPGNLSKFKKLSDSSGSVLTWHDLTYHDIPFEIELDDKDSIGIDRLLAAFAAKRLYGQSSSVIVIDCGTALTIDLVNRDNVFCGGLIIAGPTANLLALSQLTAALPDLSKSKIERPRSIIGKSTGEAMLSGAYYSGLGAIKQAVEEISQKICSTPLVVGTGGGLGPWRADLPAEWILVDNLVLDGIFLAAANLGRHLPVN